MIDLQARGLRPPDSRPRQIDGVATIAELLDPLLVDHGDDPILVGRSARYTVAELERATNRAANALRSLGVKPGVRVAASLPNDTDIVVAFLGAMKAGAIWLGINRPLAPPEKTYMLRDSETEVFLGDAETVDRVDAGRADLPDLREVIAVGGDTDPWASMLAAAETARPPVAVDPLTPAAIAYTSGTTGFPKGAVHTQHNLLLPGKVGILRGTDPAIRSVIGVALPLTILNLMILGPVAAYQAGNPIVTMDRLDAVGMAEWIHAEKISTFAAVPAMVHDLLTHPDVTDEMLTTIDAIGVGGADLPDAFRRLYESRFHRRIGSSYGLTEAPTAVTVEDVGTEPVAGASGTALPQLKVHIISEGGEDVGPGEVGEVCVGPAAEGPFADVYRPMLGYWNRPEETDRALRGGLLHTNDLGMLDEGGNLHIKDRRNDLIIRGGANVYPAEIERVLHDADGVAACAVVGRPDERLGERVVAFVQCEPDVVLDGEALRERCLTNLARYKVPDTVEFVTSFDRTPMGKIRKGPLRERASGS
jgi:acyl-CoA synthetase (AMP-forming)/AMP-acid ligase II